MNTTRLNAIILAAQGRGPQIEPETQRELILFRLALGKGSPVPLPQIQQGEHGTFVSDPQARIHELRRVYLIDCDTRNVAGERHSAYTLKLHPDQSPMLKGEVFKPTPIPKAPIGGTERKPPQAQPNLFRTLDDVRAFCSYETGGRR